MRSYLPGCLLWTYVIHTHPYNNRPTISPPYPIPPYPIPTLPQQIQQGMLRDPKAAVRRAQSVRVKVISITGTKLSLSMKEVDQRTGAFPIE